jgi:hypothetical protein
MKTCRQCQSKFWARGFGRYCPNCVRARARERKRRQYERDRERQREMGGVIEWVPPGVIEALAKRDHKTLMRMAGMI